METKQKSTKTLAILVLALGLMVCLTGVSKAEETMGTAITYQGRLIDANDAADGLYDFEFKLFDDANTITGNQLGSAIDINDLDVIDGYFTVALDFNDPNAFNGDARWLEIDVRPGDSNDVNDFVTLSPRQEVTPVPYALQTRGFFVDEAGNVGIGTTNPQARLHVHGAIISGNSMKFDGPEHRIVSQEDMAIGFGSPPWGQFNPLTFNNINVGIGTVDPITGVPNPAVKLDVNGDGYYRGGNLFVASATQPNRTYEIRVGGRQEIYNRNDFVHFSGSNVQFVLNSDEFGGGGNDEFFISVGSTAAADRRFVLEGTSGNVGIGTTDPTQRLDVAGQARIRVLPAGDFNDVVVADTNGVLYTRDANMLGGADHDWYEAGGTTPPDNINDDIYTEGNVGIGTSNPQYALTVDGSGNEVYMVMSEDGTDSVDHLKFQLAPGQGTPSTRIGYLMGHFGSANGFFFGNAANAPLRFVTQGAANEKMRINANGDVGIGTTSPTEKLDVAGQARIRVLPVDPNIASVVVADGTGVLYTRDASTLGGADNDWSGAGSGQMYTTNLNDKVGIGTSGPQYRLTVDGSGNEVYMVMSEDGTENVDNLVFQIAPGSGSPSTRRGHLFGHFGNGLFFGNSSDNGPLHFVTGSGVSTKMTIVTNGNVGIGTASPTEKLDVDGTARLRGITVGGVNTVNVVVDLDGKLWKTVSSKRYKTNISDLEISTDAVLELRPVSFQYKSSGHRDIGLIAEEVEEQLKDLVIYDKQGRPDAVRYDKVSLYLLAVVKELKAENTQLKERLETLERAIQPHQLLSAKEVQQ